MNKNVIIGLVILIILGIGGFMFMNRTTQVPQTPTTDTTTDTLPPTTMEDMQDSTASDSAGMQSGTIKEFNVGNSGTAFTIKEMRVNKGDTVRVTFTVSGGNHDWVVDQFNAKTKVLKAGEQETIEFVADEAGTFEYYCSVPGHRQAGMVGKLIVQ